MQEALHLITQLSHAFGTPDYVKGGGGNTSVKTGDTLWIKPSGTTLAGLKPDAFVPIDRPRLQALIDMVPPADASAREEMVKNLLQDAVLDVTRGRPSVETPLHDMLRATFVVHTHPPLVNGMTCGIKGATWARRLFPEALWVPYTDPGYVLSMRVRDEVNAYERAQGCQPALIFLENHGVFVSGDTPDEVRAIYAEVMATLARHVEAAGVSIKLAQGRKPEPVVAAERIGLLRGLLGQDANGVSCRAPCRVAPGPLTPDHMVYAKAYPFSGNWDADGIKDFVAQHGYTPRVFSCDDALFTVGTTQVKAELAMTLALDGALVVQLAEAFGGPQTMSDDARRFIESWEVESYREKISTK